MVRERYFDNAATSPLDPRVLSEMMPFLTGEFGNASSIHGFGLRAASAVELAQQRIMKLTGAEDPSQIIFTSGATESDNWVMQSFSDVWTSPFEHRAILEPAVALHHKFMANRGWDLFPPDRDCELVSVMSVNNETGTIWDPTQFGRRAKHVHSDITQQLGKLPTNVSDFSYASCSAHKLYGPKGVGAMYMRDEAVRAFILGGDQQLSRRAGTLNVPGIVGFGAAAAIASDELEQDLALADELRSAVLHGLGNCVDMRVNESTGSQSPFILSLSFLGLEGESLVIEMDRAGYAISGGAACSSRAVQPSHVLVALGAEPAWIRGTVRISFGRFNTVESAESLSKNLLFSTENLRRMK